MSPCSQLEEPRSIRLLLLRQGEPDSEIEIVLQEHALDELPKFEALSYSWASEDGDCQCSSIVGVSGANIAITKNCEAALRRLRNRDSDRVLWIDAICP